MTGGFKTIALLLFTAFLHAYPTLAFAQQKPEIEIDNRALRDYRPPPMFGTVEKPELSRPSAAPGWEPRLTRDSFPARQQGTPGTEDLLNTPSSSGEIAGPSVIKKTQTQIPGPKRTAKVPLPARKKTAFKQPALADVPLPVRKPALRKPLKSAAKTGGSRTKTRTMVMARPSQADVPTMPAVPAKAVNKEVLYEHHESRSVTLGFANGVTELDGLQREKLRSEIMSVMAENDGAKLLITAFATPADETVSSARRVSLSRALSAREYLIAQGVDPTRIDVRAMGDETDKEPVDRVEFSFTGGDD